MSKQNRGREPTGEPGLQDPRLARFVLSLPPRYRQRFEPATWKEHLRIAESGDEETVALGLLSASAVPGQMLCAVAKDRPGLLSGLEEGLAEQHFDILSVEGFVCQSSQDFGQASYFVALRGTLPHRDKPRGRPNLVELAEVLENALGQPRNLQRVRGETQVASFAALETIVRFIEDERNHVAFLEIEAERRSGQLLDVCQVLFGEKVQIVGSQIRTVEGRMQDRFHVAEMDERSIPPERRRRIQSQVLRALDTSLVESSRIHRTSPWELPTLHVGSSGLSEVVLGR